MAHVCVLHGPNLNLLGGRESKHYGVTTLSSLNQQLKDVAKKMKHTLTCVQSNSEAQCIDWIHRAQNDTDCIIINAAALTHTSIALRDALIAVDVPFIEVHMSNIYQRESYRHHSYLADRALGVIIGFGVYSYIAALHAADFHLTTLGSNT